MFFFRFVATLFRFVARFACVRIEDSSWKRFASTAYFAKPGFDGGECSGGEYSGHQNIRYPFSEGLAPLGIIGAQLRAPIKDILDIKDTYARIVLFASK